MASPETTVPAPTDLLKRGRGRSVRVEAAQGGPPVVVKRFHGPHVLARWGDRRRARHEHELLRHLARAGVSVPEPLALRERDGGWEVVMALVPEAVTLYDAMTGATPWPVVPERVAAPLGRLLAGLHAAGVDHSDLHANNVLLDRAGRPWMVDFHAAERRAHLGTRERLRDLELLAAAGRQWLPPRFRARVLLAWWRAQPQAERAQLGPRAELARRVEARGRALRREQGARRARRWLRDSGACRRVATYGGPAFQRPDLPRGWSDHQGPSLLRAAAAAARLATPLRAAELASPDVLVLRGGDLDATRRGWLAAARLEELAVPAARPLAFVAGARPWAAFLAPEGVRPVAQALEEPPARRRVLRAAGHLIGTLHDRGVDLARPSLEALIVAPDLHVRVGVVDELADHEPGPGGDPLAAWEPLAGVLRDATPRERAAFAAGYARALRLPRAAAAALCGAPR